MAKYPDNFDQFPATTPSPIPLVVAPGSLLDQLFEAVAATQIELGTNPAGSAIDVKSRLATSLKDDGGLKDALVTRSATLVVAASDSSAKSKSQADYVCDGADDQVEIQAAIDALPTKDVSGESFTAGPFSQWDSFDASAANWVGIQGDEVLSDDGAVYKEGTGSLKIVGGTNNYPGVKKSGLASLDWSSYNSVDFFVKADAIDWLWLEIYDSAGSFYRWEWRIRSTGWQSVKFDLGNPDVVVGGLDFADVVEVRIQVRTITDGYTFRIDDFRLNTWVELEDFGIVSGSDSISGYVFGTDYDMNYRDGKIKAYVHGSMTSGNSYTIDYSYYLGGKIVLLEGNYVLNYATDLFEGELPYAAKIISSKTILSGVGGVKIKLVDTQISGRGQPIILVGGARQVVIENLYLDGNLESGCGGTGIALFDCKDSMVMRCHVDSTDQSMLGLYSVENSIVAYNTFRTKNPSSGCHGIDLDYWTPNVRSRNILIIWNESDADNRLATRIENATDIIYIGNTFGSSVEVGSNDADPLQLGRVYFMGNNFGFVTVALAVTEPVFFIDNHFFHGRLVVTGNPIGHIVIQGNHFEQNLEYSILNVEAAIGVISIKDNHIIDPARYGIRVVDISGTVEICDNVISYVKNVSKSWPSIYVRGANAKWIISRNYIVNTYEGIRVENSSKNEVSNNHIEGRAGLSKGVRLENCSSCVIKNNTVTNCMYGVFEQATCTDMSYLNNSIYNVGTQAFCLKGASARLRFTEGFISENSSTATITNGSTNIDVAHGLDFPVADFNINLSIDRIAVTPTSDLGNATKFWVSNVGNSTFRINVDLNPGVDITFSWQVHPMY